MPPTRRGRAAAAPASAAPPAAPGAAATAPAAAPATAPPAASASKSPPPGDRPEGARAKPRGTRAKPYTSDVWDEEAERDGSGGGDWHDYEWTFTDVQPKGRAPEATWTGTYRQMRWMLDDGLNKELVKLWKSARYERHNRALRGTKEADKQVHIKGGSDQWKKRKLQPCWQTGPAAAAAADSSADDGSTVTKQRLWI